MPRSLALLLLVLTTLTGVTLAGCTSPMRNGLSGTTTTAIPSTGGHGDNAAKVQWVGDALVSGVADQNTALQVAVDDLRVGQSSDRGHTSDYDAVIAAITNLEALPITSVTPREDAQGNADIAKVNRFFAVPKDTLEASCNASGPGLTLATKAWRLQPANISSGVHVRSLKSAITDLQHGLITDSHNSCYPAAIEDLHSLESATRPEIVASTTATPGGGYEVTNIYGDEIAYINVFFGSSGQLVLTA